MASKSRYAIPKKLPCDSEPTVLRWHGFRDFVLLRVTSEDGGPGAQLGHVSSMLAPFSLTLRCIGNRHRAEIRFQQTGSAGLRRETSQSAGVAVFRHPPRRARARIALLLLVFLLQQMLLLILRIQTPGAGGDTRSV